MLVMGQSPLCSQDDLRVSEACVVSEIQPEAKTCKLYEGYTSCGHTGDGKSLLCKTRATLPLLPVSSSALQRVAFQ